MVDERHDSTVGFSALSLVRGRGHPRLRARCESRSGVRFLTASLSPPAPLFWPGQLPSSSSLEVAMETSQKNPEEEIMATVGEASEPVTEKEEGHSPCGADSEMQQILARVRQNFGKINVVPQFSGDDLVPVEMSDIDEEPESFSEEEEEEQELPGDEEEESCPESQEEHTESDTKAVIKALDEKIAKYQKFLNKAKAKKFSAVR